MRRWDGLVDRYIATCQVQGFAQGTLDERASELARFGTWRRPCLQQRHVSSSAHAMAKQLSHLRGLLDYSVAKRALRSQRARRVQSARYLEEVRASGVDARGSGAAGSCLHRSHPSATAQSGRSSDALRMRPSRRYGSPRIHSERAAQGTPLLFSGGWLLHRSGRRRVTFPFDSDRPRARRVQA